MKLDDGQGASASPRENAPVYELADRGFVVRAFYSEADRQNADIIVTRDGQPFREFKYPAYRIWNIAAHFGDMVDDILDNEATPSAPSAPSASEATS